MNRQQASLKYQWDGIVMIQSHWFSMKVLIFSNNWRSSSYICGAVQKTDQLARIQTLPVWFPPKRNMFSPVSPPYFCLYFILSLSHLFLYRLNVEESDALISKERYIHLHEEYSDDNKLSSAPWLTYSDSDSIQQNRTQRISQCPRYIIMRAIQYISGYIG